jgi:hypothetical protein
MFLAENILPSLETQLNDGVCAQTCLKYRIEVRTSLVEVIIGDVIMRCILITAQVPISIKSSQRPTAPSGGDSQRSFY